MPKKKGSFASNFLGSAKPQGNRKKRSYDSRTSGPNHTFAGSTFKTKRKPKKNR